MAAPLIAGNDLTTMSSTTKDILTNPDVIAVDQDPLGEQGRPVSSGDGVVHPQPANFKRCRCSSIRRLLLFSSKLFFHGS